MLDRIKTFFSLKTTKPPRSTLLSERGHCWCSGRDRLYEDLGKVEAREAKL
jgi:hypothetical protein